MTPASLRLASYNIRAGLGRDWRRDPARALAVIDALDPDIIVLQEADFRMGHRPTALPRNRIADLTDLHPLPLDGHQDSLGWHGIAIMTRAGITLEQADCIDLPGLEPRGAVIADLTTPLGPLRLAGVHLGLLRRSRRQQLDHLRMALQAMPPRPTLIAGDFNEWSIKRGLGRIARSYQIVTPHRSFPAGRPLLALDRVAHSPDLLVSPQGLPDMPLLSRASDHLPILTTVTRAPAFAPCEAAAASLPSG